MNKKCLLQDLVSDFREISTIPDAQQQQFVTVFFQIILEGLKRDKIVKIKGFGTFKMVEVEKRMSVDINTKERIEIESHSKISFVPDASVKSQINKPFEQFETVVINENLDLENTQEEKNSPEKHEKGFRLETSKQEERLIPESKNTEYDIDEIEPKEGRRKKLKCVIWILVIILLMGLSYLAGFYHLFGCAEYYQKAEIDTAQIKEPQKPKVWLTGERGQKSQIKGANIGKKEVGTVTSPKEELNFPPVEGDKYKIVGLKQTYVLQKGETLNKIAKRIYGNKYFVKYIIRYNHLSNPDNIECGMEIRLPLLTLNR